MRRWVLLGQRYVQLGCENKRFSFCAPDTTENDANHETAATFPNKQSICEVNEFAITNSKENELDLHVINSEN